MTEQEIQGVQMVHSINPCDKSFFNQMSEVFFVQSTTLYQSFLDLGVSHEAKTYLKPIALVGRVGSLIHFVLLLGT